MVWQQFLFSLQAALFAAIWLVYFRKLDIFHPEKWKHMILVFVIGLATPLIVLYAPGMFTDFYLTGNYWRNFEMLFLKVGLVEEFAKIIPLLFIALFTKWIDEPIDYVIYAALLALGFSATENVVYMNRASPDILAVRGLISSFGHIAFTGIAVYGWVEGRYRYKKLAPLYFVWTFVLAALAHAVFDGLLILPYAWKIPVFIVFYIFLLEVWALIVNNSLNNSVHYHKKIVVDDNGLQYQMRAGFVINALVQCLITYLLIGTLHKTFMGIYATYFFTAVFFFFFVSRRLTHFTIVPNKWYTLFPQVPVSSKNIREKPPGDYKKAWFVKIKGTDTNEHMVSARIGEEIELVPLSQQKLAIPAVIKGRIEDKLFLHKDEVFYLFRSSVKLPNENFNQSLLLLKAFDGSPNIIEDKYPVMAVLAVPHNADWALSHTYHRKHFPFIQWMVIKPAGDKKIAGHRVTDLS